MPTATRSHLSIRPSLSTSVASSPSRFTVKLAPAIDSATVISFEKRMDLKIWYIIKVEPQKQPHSSNKNVRPYIIGRRYEDFAQFSQNLYDRFNTSKQRAGSRLPPKIKNRLNILPASKQLHAQRAEELNQFLSILFQNQSNITESYLVLEFFGIQKADHIYIDGLKENMTLPNHNDSRYDDSTTSRWKRLRCTSFLARSPPSSTGLSSLCSQAANKIIPSWNRNSNNNNVPCSPQPSISTPINHATLVSTRSLQRNTSEYKEGLKKSKSTVWIGSQHPLSGSANNSSSVLSNISSSQISTSTCATSIILSPSSSSQQLKSTIKIKVIYDVDNIIVIQVPRTISFIELHSRIAQKFSDPSMGGGVHIQDQVKFLYNDSMSSCCSVTSLNNMALPSVLIHKEQDLVQIMNTKWNRLEKVTLRCVL